MCLYLPPLWYFCTLFSKWRLCHFYKKGSRMVNSTSFFCIQVSTCDLESPLQSEQTISHLEFIKQGREGIFDCSWVELWHVWWLVRFTLVQTSPIHPVDTWPGVVQMVCQCHVTCHLPCCHIEDLSLPFLSLPLPKYITPLMSHKIYF